MSTRRKTWREPKHCDCTWQGLPCIRPVVLVLRVSPNAGEDSEPRYVAFCAGHMKAAVELLLGLIARMAMGVARAKEGGNGH